MQQATLESLIDAKHIASLAIRAAKNRKAWGEWATNRFIKKHNIPARVMTLANKLEIQNKLGVC